MLREKRGFSLALGSAQLPYGNQPLRVWDAAGLWPVTINSINKLTAAMPYK